MAGWTSDLVGRTYVVTGANGGLGLHTSAGLARRGAKVVMACRDLVRAEDAIATLRRAHPEADLVARRLDLADLRSIESFAIDLADLVDRCDGPMGLDGLVNNAGIMAPPRGETRDGFELQIGVNHLGHFALTGRLLPLLRARPGARVVTVTSLMHAVGKIRFDDLMGQRRYERWTAYAQSKLANLMFAFELHRRLAAARIDLASVAAHPGYARTGLQTAAADHAVFGVATMLRLGTATIAQSAKRGAATILFACADPSVQSGDVIGPGGPFQIRGAPRRVRCYANARDDATAAELWRVSEQLTGVRWPELAS